MKRIFLVLLLCGVSISAQYKQSIDNDFTDRIVKLTYNLDYVKANTLLDEKIKKNDKEPVPLLLKGIVKWKEHSYSYSGHTHIVNQQCLYYLKKTVSIAEDNLRKNNRDTMSLFCAGAALGYYALYLNNADSSMAALSVGKKGKEYLDKLIEMCPGWTDIYFSTGLYNLYTSSVPWYLKPVLFVLGKGGTKSDAYKYLSMVADKGKIAKYEARLYLAILMILENKYNDAEYNIEKIAQEFPDVGLHYYYYYSILLAKENIDEYINYCNKIINKYYYQKLSMANASWYATLGYHLMDYYEKSKLYDQEIVLGQKLLNKKSGAEKIFHFRVGSVYLMKNNKSEAKKHFEWVLANTSNNDYYYKEAKNKLQGF